MRLSQMELSSDGETLKVNMAFLFAESDVFRQMFRDSSGCVINIEDFDLTTFKLFLDCLLKFQDFSVEDALLIFPIAWKFETEDLISKCLEILKPTCLNENICLSLNIGLFCDCKELTKSLLDFLDEKKLIYKLLDEELYYNHLEPEAMLEILKVVKVDSRVLKNVISWGKHYLDKRNKPLTLKEFFTQEKVINHVKFDIFETAGTFLNFSESEIGLEFFTDSDFRKYVKKYGYDNREINWVNVKKGESLTEKFIIKNFGLWKKYFTNLRLYRNSIIFFNVPDSKKEVLATYDFVGKLLGHDDENKDKAVAFRGVADINLDTSFSEGTFDYKSLNPLNVISDVEVQIKIDFKYDCRIGKSIQENFSPIDADTDQSSFFYKWEILGYEKL